MQPIQCNRCGTLVTPRPGQILVCPNCGNGAPPKRKSSIVSLLTIFGVLGVCSCAGLGVMAGIGNSKREHAEAERAQQAEEATRIAEEEQERKDAELRRGLDSALDQIPASTDLVNQALTASDYPGARRELGATQDLVTRYRDLQEPPEALTGALAEWDKASAAVSRIEGAEEASELARQRITEADGQARRAPVEAERLYQEALAALARLEGVPEDVVRSARPPTRASVERKLARVAPAAQRVRAEQERERLELERLHAVCGEAPTISAWDGELLGSESFIANHANDPDSVDVEHCTRPVLNKRECWRVECDVLGRNAFGAMVRNRYRFSVAGGVILGASQVR